MMVLVMMRLYHDTVGGGSVGVSPWFCGGMRMWRNDDHVEMMWRNEKPILISIMLR